LEILQKSAVVTGASTGIGRAVVASLAGAGWRVFGSVRKEADAASLKATFGSAFTPLLFDVTDAAAIAHGAEAVKQSLGGRTLDGLINNAGIAVGGPLRYIPLLEIERQIDVNVYGPLRVTQAFLPMLGADRAFKGEPGKIINMSSVAGKLASPFLAPYAMSKHALEAFSDSLRRELLVHGIDVITVAPGAIATPIWAKADEINVEQYKNTEYYDLLARMRSLMQEVGNAGLPPEAVGDLVLRVLKNPRPKARYAVLRDKLRMWTLPNMLPKRVVDGFIAKRFGIPPRPKA
jgi:NAD(P)-dependent dehydrogenase (short-subunit alcohol dehydrogenase family)